MKNKELHSEFTFQIEPKHYFKHNYLTYCNDVLVSMLKYADEEKMASVSIDLGNGENIEFEQDEKWQEWLITHGHREEMYEVYYRQENLSAVIAHGGLEGLRLLEENKDTCSLIILDVMMPDMNGFQVLQEIRKKNNVPVLMLTAKSDEEDKVSGLRLGADDYLTQPFGINELMARVNSLIRRYTTLNPVAGSEAATMLLKDMVIDKVNRTVTLQNLPVELTGKEFDLLVFLASNKGRVFTKKQIYTQVWAEEYAFDDSNIMSFISKLRKKIEPNPEQPFYIQTVRGVGYRFNKEV